MQALFKNDGVANPDTIKPLALAVTFDEIEPTNALLNPKLILPIVEVRSRAKTNERIFLLEFWNRSSVNCFE